MACINDGLGEEQGTGNPARLHLKGIKEREMKGRDKEYKCIVCGKYIAYKDIPDKVITKFTPDTEFTTERTEMWHKRCDDQPLSS